ncbi:MAG: DUF4339 domain-containing protein [Planctomycetia bacterium]|nr:DUF4339 domain-containing protein [Planctomycetia bacterium]
MANVPNESRVIGGSPSGGPPKAPPRSSGADSVGATASVWYLARGGKTQQEGPFSLAALKEQVASGSLAPNDLAWREGLTGWMPAQEVPGLFGQSGAPSEILQPVAPSSGGLPSWVRKIADSLTHPVFFFIAGLVFALAAVLATFGSLIALVMWKMHWFGGAVLFLLLFIVCEAASGILEVLRRADGEKRERP